MKINIAIDGVVASGKGITSKLLAKKLNYNFLDTGAMYRAVGYYLNQNKITKELFKENDLIGFNIDFNKDNEIILNGENIESEIRTPLIGKLASDFSTIGIIRKFLVKIQKEIVKNKGFIAEGRDIGTVVMPNAEVKIFLTANIDVRARRRLEDFKKKGIMYTMEEVKIQIEERDKQDMTRDESPLLKSKESIEIDNSTLTIYKTVDLIYGIVKMIN